MGTSARNEYFAAAAAVAAARKMSCAGRAGYSLAVDRTALMPPAAVGSIETAATVVVDAAAAAVASETSAAEMIAGVEMATPVAADAAV